MYVCVCNAVTENDIRQAAADGVRRFSELQARTGCSTCCGCCEAEARGVLRDAISEAVRPARIDLPLTCAA